MSEIMKCTQSQKKRLLSLLLSICMIVSMFAGLSITAIADNITDVTTYTEFENALADSAVKTINITSSITTDSSKSITRDDVSIRVKNDAVFKISYKTNQDTQQGTLCNADITVENGGSIVFYAQNSFSGYNAWLILKGDFTLNEGAIASFTNSAYAGEVAFQGKFVNNGTFDVSDGKPYVKYGISDNVEGNIISSKTADGKGKLNHNFCVTTPSQQTMDTELIQYTDISGDLKVGSNLTLVVDGFGEVTNDDFCNVNWYIGDSAYATQQNKAVYTVPSAAAGQTISSRANGFVNSATSAYLIISETGVVKKILNFSSDKATTSDIIPSPEVIYVGGNNASASNSGTTADAPVDTFINAYQQVKDGGTIVVMGAVTIPVDSSFRYGIYKNLTITGTYNDITYPDAKLINTGLYIITKEVTFRDISLAASGDSVYRGYIFAGENAVINLDNIKKEDTIKFSGNEMSGVKLNVKDCFLNMSTSVGTGTIGTLDITLDNAGIASTFPNTSLIGNVSLKNNSTLVTTQTVNNITADDTNNVVCALFSDAASASYPGVINVTGTVTQAAPIRLGLVNENLNTVALVPGHKILTSALSDNLKASDYTLSSADYPEFGIKKSGNDICGVSVVEITGAAPMLNLVYNGEKQSGYTGVPTVSGHEELDSTFVYTYYKDNKATETPDWQALTEEPSEAGSYKLTISVPDENSNYLGKLDIEFTIAKKPIIIKLNDVSIRRGNALPAWEVDFSGLTEADKTIYADAITAINNLINTEEYTVAITVNDAVPSTSSTGSYTVKFAQEAIDKLKAALEAQVTLLNSCYDVTYLTDSTLNVTSSGGGSVSSTYTVTYNTNGGNTITSTKIKRNTVLAEPTVPTKEGYVFDGWYTDKDFTAMYNFTEKVTKPFTLYAKWTENPIDTSKNEIILTIGKKDAVVFGESKANDVAPLIRNDRTMLPVRFIAESLGAKVEWDETAPGIITITKDDITIVIRIGEKFATVNGEQLELDSPAFIENDRTYTPIRFISERLGATVDWNEVEQKVTITRK